MLERASFYGFRALLVLYMVGLTLKMDHAEALNIYGWFTTSLVFAQIVGAVLGDLIIGNKKLIIFGGVAQATGSFIICFPNNFGLFTGLILIVLGSGFFRPNIIASYGKSYLDKIKLLDAGFTIFFLAINTGAFIGVYLIAKIGLEFGFKVGFIISGLLILLSLIPILKTKELEKIQASKELYAKRVLAITIGLTLVGAFFGINEITDIRILDLQIQFGEKTMLGLSTSIWQSLDSIYTIPITIIAIVVWTFFFSSQFFKLLIGFSFGAIAFGILLSIPELIVEKHTLYYLLAMLFLAISEVHISPIIYSILTKYSNQKYLAILISLAFLPTKIFALIFGLFSDRFQGNPILGLKCGVVAMTILIIAIIGYILIDKRNYLQQRL